MEDKASSVTAHKTDEIFDVQNDWGWLLYQVQAGQLFCLLMLHVFLTGSFMFCLISRSFSTLNKLIIINRDKKQTLSFLPNNSIRMKKMWRKKKKRAETCKT